MYPLQAMRSRRKLVLSSAPGAEAGAVDSYDIRFYQPCASFRRARRNARKLKDQFVIAQFARFEFFLEVGAAQGADGRPNAFPDRHLKIKDLIAIPLPALPAIGAGALLSHTSKILKKLAQIS